MTVVLKPGRKAIDPNGRVVEIVGMPKDGMIRVRLAGPYGAHLTLPVSVLQPAGEA